MEGLTLLEDMTPWERHLALCQWARLLARERHMTHKTVGELIESGEWAGQLYPYDCDWLKSPYEPESWMFYTGARRPGNNIHFDRLERIREYQVKMLALPEPVIFTHEPEV